ncbi:MAG: response regulator [Planctomycetota bacterium]
MSSHILFVDDEPNVLSGLRRMLRPQRNTWKMSFVDHGAKALELLEKESVNVLVTDMRMPEMDGAELLNEVAQRHPSVVRLVLSGQSDHERVMRVVGPAHQFLSKPCHADELIATITRVQSLCDRLSSDSMQSLISKFRHVPTLPDLYRQLVIEMQSDEASLERIGDLIASDLAMSVKVLQLVNSSFFGLATEVTCPKQAVSMLGLGLLRSLVLMANLFVEYEDVSPDYSLTEAVDHGLAVATATRRVAVEARLDPRDIETAYVAGMMHHLGEIILAINLPEAYAEAKALAEEKIITTYEAEVETLGVTHAEIGAYLLTLWGLPTSIGDAVAHHHELPLEGDEGHGVLNARSAVAIADRWVHHHNERLHPASISRENAFIKEEQLRALGAQPSVEHYEQLLSNPEVG